MSRAIALVAPPALFAVWLAASAPGPVSRRITVLPVTVLLAAAVYAVPVGLSLFVRSRAAFYGVVVAMVGANIWSIVEYGQSTSSTKALLFLWIPWIATPVALTALAGRTAVDLVRRVMGQQ